MDRDHRAPLDASLGALSSRPDDAVVVADVDADRIVLWSAAAEAMFGYTAAEALALTVDALVPAHLRGLHWMGLARFAAAIRDTTADGAGVVSLTALRRSGEEFAIELSLSPYSLPDGQATPYALAVIRDVSKRPNADVESTSHADEYTRLVEKSHTLQVVAAEIASVRDTDSLLRRIVDHAMAVLGADGCAVWLFDESQMPRLKATRGLSDEFHQRLAAEHRRHVAAGTEAALTGQPAFVRDFAEVVRTADPDFAATLRREGLVSGLRLPLREPGGQVAGWLTLYHRRERLYSEDEVRLAQAFADQIAVALRNARLTEQERAAREDADRRLERVTALSRITEQLLGIPDSDAVLRVVVDAAAHLSGTQVAEVCLIEDGGHHLRSTAAHGPLPPRTAGEVIGWSSGPAGEVDAAIRRALIERRAIAVGDAEGGPSEAAAMLRATIAAPMLVAGRPIGVLWVGDPAPRRFSSEDVALVQALADQAALTIEHARLVLRDRETAVLEERARLARDLHDSVTQSIFSLGMLTGAAQAQYERGVPALGKTLARVGQVAKEALAEMRALLVTLRPVALDEEGLSGALEKLAASYQTRSGLTIAFRAETDARLAPEAETAIYRIVQEALANITKHAEATEATVTLAERGGVFRVTVTDNGRGFDPAVPAEVSSDGRRGGMGLRSMRERAATAGIAIEITSAPGAGAAITLTAPVHVDGFAEASHQDVGAATD
ncbi:MAG: GAF domain-containing protein [Dehalococcoidia bacterium]